MIILLRELPVLLCFLIGRNKTSPTYVASSPVRLEYSAIRLSNSWMDSLALRLSSTDAKPPYATGTAVERVGSAAGERPETADTGTVVVLACAWRGVLEHDEDRDEP